jgi:DNA-binding GntR family transcriptional regulator
MGWTAFTPYSWRAAGAEAANISNLPRATNVAPSLTQCTYDLLREALLDCRFKSGERLRIGELRISLGSSQAAVREALSRLTSEGLVEARPQHGFRVTPISIADLRDLTAARIEIEELCLRHAIEAADVRWEAHIVAAFHQLSRSLEQRTESRIDHRFVALYHSFFDVLVSSCDSLWLRRVRQMLQVQERRYQVRSPLLMSGKDELVGELREIMEAAIARDAGYATKMLAIHMRRFGELLTAQIANN